MTGARRTSDGDSTSPSPILRAEHLSALLDHSPSLVFLKDEDGRYVYLNKTYEDDFVHSADWHGKTDYDFWPKDSAELFRANDAEVMRSGEVHQFTEDSLDLEGKRHVWVNYKFPLTDSEGRRYIGGIGIDATRMTEAEEALRASERANAWQAEILKSVRDPLWVSSPELRVTYWSDAAEEMFGWSAEEALGQDTGELFQTILPGSTREAAVRRTLQEGEFFGEVLLRRKDGTRVWAEASSRAIRGPDGTVTALVNTVRDITGRKRVEENLHASEEQYRTLYEAQRTRRRRIEALHQVIEVALSTLDVHSAAQRILDHLSHHYDFDLSSIWMAADDSLELVAQVGFPPDWVRSLPLDAPYDSVQAFNAGATLIVRDPSNESVLEVYRRMGVALDSYMILPLKARGRAIGVLNLVWTEAHELNEYDAEFFESVADEVAVVLENARLYEVEHRIAETLQETLVVLPALLPGVTFARAYESATWQPGWVGGDFVDLFQISTDKVGVVIGDVSGKGTEAAVTTSLVRNTLRAFALDGLSPSEVCDKTNTVTRRFTEAEAFVTLFFGILDTLSGTFRYSAAGHPPAMILAEGGGVRDLPVSGDAMIGAFEEFSCSEQEATLQRGDRLLLYTDGVIEARLSGSHDLWGESRLRAALEAHAEEPTSRLPKALMEEVIAFSEGVLRDDAAILVVELTCQGPDSETAVAAED